MPGRSASKMVSPQQTVVPTALATVFPAQFPVCWCSPVRALNTVDFPTLGIPARATTGCSRWDSSGGSSADDVRIARFVLSIAWFFAILCGKERKKTACEKAVFFKCVRMVCEVFKAYLAYLAYKKKILILFCIAHPK